MDDAHLTTHKGWVDLKQKRLDYDRLRINDHEMYMETVLFIEKEKDTLPAICLE